jgi:hypothetical protein
MFLLLVAAARIVWKREVVRVVRVVDLRTQTVERVLVPVV